ncbi:UDP-N-acetylmuramoyl-L-alanyl-D-glutamate--2,6-diaminopimelate ligase [Aureivirga marina]|uniref:UDP-N-acetylmuramoyl-L-alanyl-D-glutamate--2, 6-diaminopimelate ligase n=1 Tax=Aureivirga marina TaxID=1182451 RepID=UPI0018C94357|nr:UDP-N-acetylmuramoyl-L-alanyl-D-glutamate--2,6-diaminopimelate ligase [Aureivirga marina]
MKLLKDILLNVSIEEILGNMDTSINNITFDSRKVTENDLFVAIKGTVVDGHQYVEKAIKLGASVIVCEEKPKEPKDTITYIIVQSSTKALARMASNFYGNPSKKLKLVGITGTNGKTTIATLLYNLFEKAGFKTGLLSTVINKIHGENVKATHTTPDSLSINYLMRKMVNAGVTHCFMEVSSHGIHQNRTEALDFDGAVFTNLTHDHLDYHETFKEYRDVKKMLFDNLSKEAFALVNIDDKNGPIMFQNTKAKKYSYALKTMADFKGKVLENQISGICIEINNMPVWTRLIGSFNAYNLLAIYGVAQLLGLEQLRALELLSELETVSGRFQYQISPNGTIAIIDYAHTPDALKNVLETIHDIKDERANVITVVGCGGDRDAEKRPKMGQIASNLSDQVVFTSDNPRTEDEMQILDQIIEGVLPENKPKVVSIPDREQAIRMAIKLAEKSDIVLVAGKGHETYQEINGIRNNFDDYQVVEKIFLEQVKI